MAGSQGYLLDERLPDSDQVHDREHARALVVVRLDLPIVREHQADIGRAIDEGGDFAGAEHCIEFAVDKHLVQRLSGSDRLQVDIAAELQGRALVPARLFLAAGAPVNVGRIDAVLLLEDAAHPDVCGLLVFRKPTSLPLRSAGPRMLRSVRM